MIETTKQLPLLFPPYLGPGSWDLGPRGPVRCLQRSLELLFPRLAKDIGFAINGDYGLKTRFLVAVMSVRASWTGSMPWSLKSILGHCDSATLSYLSSELIVDADVLAFQPGCECMYIRKGTTKPALWNPLLETVSDGTLNVPASEIGQHSMSIAVEQ